MIKRYNLRVPPEVGYDFSILKEFCIHDLKLFEEDIKGIKIIRRSIDARSRKVIVQLTLDIYFNEELPNVEFTTKNYPNVSSKNPVLVVGAGPAGLFAALRLIQHGLKPIILERGKNVRERRKDLAAINKYHIVNPNSNYCFGEGGAGTYSDGKLYTRSSKRGNIKDVLDVFFEHGASEDILIDTHPHIGTNKLPGIISSMREQILACGGEIYFDTRITAILMKNDSIVGVETDAGNVFNAPDLILATGHSARDVYHLLHKSGIELEFKPFALGVRAEHPQLLIDQIQYHCDSRGDFLPPASYSLVHQSAGRGVYSFCMCPGGIIAPCATSPGEVVTNGWSPSKRNNPFANSGIVVEITEQDSLPFQSYGPLAGMMLQESIEKTACQLAGGTQKAPAQRMVDFVQIKVSNSLPKTSYTPGIESVDLFEVLPESIASRLQESFIAFGRKMKGYYTNEAVLHAVESRTSTPVRIPRNINTLEHVRVKGLYPCGEGAGYAGGIVSAAMDGQKCADAISIKIKNN